MKNIYALIIFSIVYSSIFSQNIRWDNQFNTLNAPDDTVFAITSSNNDLYIGGSFLNVAGSPANHIARFDGTSWHQLGSGVNGNVYAIVQNDLLTIVGGNFTLAGGLPAGNLAVWDGTTWQSALNLCNGTVRALLYYEGYLYVGGDFTTIGGVPANHVARFDGTTWEALGTGVDGPVYSIYHGTFLNVGGNFANAGGIAAQNIASWNGTDWQPIGDGFDGPVYSITGQGNQFTAAGNFIQSGTNLLNHIGKWDGTEWLPLETGTNGIIRKVEKVGSNYYITGNFTTAGTINANQVALWNGTNWSDLGDGLNQQGFCATHSGYDLFCGGSFTTAGLNPSIKIAKYISPPIIENQSGTITLCRGDSLVLYVRATSSLAITYHWEKDGSTVGISNDTLVIYPAQITDAGNYSCTITNAVGSVVSSSITVNVNREPVFSISQTNLSACEGDSVILNSGITGTSIITYQWYFNSALLPGKINDTLLFSSVSTAQDGNYFCIAQNLCGDDTSFFSITTHSIPSVSFSGLSSEYCINNNPVTLTGSPSGGVFSGNGVTGNLFNPSGLIGNHVVYYQYTDGNGCIGNSSDTTLVHALTNVIFSGLSPTYCYNSSNDTLDVAPGGGTFFGLGMTDSIFSPLLAGPGTHNVFYAYTDGNGCINTKSQTTQVYSKQVFTYPGLDTSFCINDNVFYIQAIPSTGVYSGNGMTGNIFNPQTAGIGTSEILYQYTDVQGCLNIDSLNFIVHALPTTSITHIMTDYCKNASNDTLTAIPAGGNFWGTNITNEILNPSAFTPGSYYAYYTYTDPLGCSNTDSASFLIKNTVTVLFSGVSTYYCENELPDSLIGIPSGGIFSGPGVNLNWFSPENAGAGIHSIIYTYDNLNGCLSYDSVHVIVTALPVVQIGPDTSICSGDTIVLTAVGDAGTYLWNTTETTSSISVSPAISTNYIVNVYDTYCYNSDTVFVTVKPLPSLNLGPDISECSPASITAPSGFDAYLWSDNSSDSVLTVTLSGTYYLTATNLNGCSNSDSIHIMVLPSPQVNLGNDQTISGLQTIIIGTSPNYQSYLWNTGSTNNSILVSGHSLGEGVFPFWLSVLNNYGCSASDTINIRVSGDVGINDLSGNAYIKLYPNPANEYINVSFEQNINNVSGMIIFSSIGEKMLELDKSSLNKSMNTLNISKWPKGLYFIQIMMNDQTFTQSFSIN